MASYARLRSGAWGVRGTPEEVQAGARVRVERRDGAVSWVRVGRVVWSDDEVALGTIAGSSRPAAAQQVEVLGVEDYVEPTVSAPVPAASPVAAPVAALASAPVQAGSVPVPAPRQAAPVPRHNHKLVITGQSGGTGRRMVQVSYYIPDMLEVGNPSSVLRRCGVRIDGSVWVIPADRVPYGLLNGLSAAGATVNVIAFADTECEALARLAEGVLRREIESLSGRLAASVAAADATVAGLDGAADGKRASEYTVRARAALRRLDRLLDDALEAADAFGVGASLTSARDAARASFRAVSTAALARAAAYAAGLALLPAGAPVGDGAPAYMLADALEDAGQGDAADAVRGAF